MSGQIALIAYLLAAFALLLGLRWGQKFVVAGIVLAVLTALMSPFVAKYTAIVGVVVTAGAVGTVLAKRMPLASLPRLIDAVHGLAGLAVLVIGIGLSLKTGASIASGASLILAALTCSGVGWALLRKRPLPSWCRPCAGLAMAALGYELANPFLVVAGGLAVSLGFKPSA